MYRLILAIMGILLLVGCAQYHVIRENNMNMMTLSVGMSKKEFIEAMGGIKTFRITEYKTVTNPYRTEQFSDNDGNVYEYLWYITKVPNFIYDGTVYEQDLTPFALINGKLAGWGWSFYRDNKQRYELDLNVTQKEIH